MTPDEVKKLPLGLYEIFWKSGGSSLASVGMIENGDRWLAPTNWTHTSEDQAEWDGVESATYLMNFLGRCLENNDPKVGDVWWIKLNGQHGMMQRKITHISPAGLVYSLQSSTKNIKHYEYSDINFLELVEEFLIYDAHK
jgi:hypothetical protein